MCAYNNICMEMIVRVYIDFSPVDFRSKYHFQTKAIYIFIFLSFWLPSIDKNQSGFAMDYTEFGRYTFGNSTYLSIGRWWQSAVFLLATKSTTTFWSLSWIDCRESKIVCVFFPLYCSKLLVWILKNNVQKFTVPWRTVSKNANTFHTILHSKLVN